MTKYKFAKEYIENIIPVQRAELLSSFEPESIGTKYINIDYNDRNFKCMPFLEPVIESKIQAISFFSGAGGLDIGAQMAGVKVISSLDFFKDSVETLKANPFFSHSEHRLDDIRNVKANDYAKVLKENNPEKLVLLGGPPCQPFSKAGYWKTHKERLGPDDPRNMIGNYLQLIDEIRPDGFLLENVESILHPHNRQAVEDLAEAITQMNYNYVLVKANACDYGVPQKRKRVFFVASKKTIKSSPVITNFEHPVKGQLPYERVIDWIGRFDEDKYLSEYDSIEGKHHDSLIMVPPGGNYISLSERRGFVPERFKAGTRYWTFLLKLHPLQPSWTIIAQPGHWEGPFHWTNRRLRLEELAAIQTFPIDYKFVGSVRSVHKQIGNAVPCLLGKSMTEYLMEIV